LSSVRTRLTILLALGLAWRACSSEPAAEQPALQPTRPAPQATAPRPTVTPKCPELDPHPIAAAIAEDLETEYDQVIEWFCGGHTFEDILLALQTEKLAGAAAADLLRERERGKPWEVIWRELGITEG
jgi:hypothetical protein